MFALSRECWVESVGGQKIRAWRIELRRCRFLNTTGFHDAEKWKLSCSWAAAVAVSASRTGTPLDRRRTRQAVLQQKLLIFQPGVRGGGVGLVDSGRILFCSHNFVHQDAPFIIFKHWPFYFYKRFLLCCLWVICLLAKDQPVI